MIHEGTLDRAALAHKLLVQKPCEMRGTCTVRLKGNWIDQAVCGHDGLECGHMFDYDANSRGLVLSAER